MVPQLLQVLDVAITDFTNDKVALALSLTRLAWLHPGSGGVVGGGSGLLDPRVVATWQWSDGYTGRPSALWTVLLTQALQ